MKTPKRLTEDNRVVIAAMQNAGHAPKEIAEAIGFSRSTVSQWLLHRSALTPESFGILNLSRV